MKVTIEEILGQQCTVVWYFGGCEADDCEDFIAHDGATLLFKRNIKHEIALHVATALPPLPKHPKPEDAKLLYRYMSEGLTPCGLCVTPYETWEVVFDNLYKEHGRIMFVTTDGNTLDEITHCTDKQGNKIDIAISEG